MVDNNGCINSDTIIVSVNPLPEVFIGNDTTITTLDTLIITTNSSFQNYYWSTGSTDTSIIVNGSIGVGVYDYSVTVVGENGCLNSDTIKVTIELPTSVNSKFDFNQIKIFPNPTNDIINIEISNSMNEDISLNVYNSLGELLIEKKFLNKTTDYIDISHFSKGIYYLKIESANINKVEKIILN